jgi:hypothetical protein
VYVPQPLKFLAPEAQSSENDVFFFGDPGRIGT